MKDIVREYQLQLEVRNENSTRPEFHWLLSRPERGGESRVAQEFPSDGTGSAEVQLTHAREFLRRRGERIIGISGSLAGWLRIHTELI